MHLYSLDKVTFYGHTMYIKSCWDPVTQPRECALWTCSNLWGNAYTCTFKGNNKIGLHPFWNRVYSKRKEFAPCGSKFFPFRVDPFSRGACNVGKQTGSHKSSLPCNKWQKIYHLYLGGLRRNKVNMVLRWFYGPVNTVKVRLSQTVNFPGQV